MKRNEIVIKMKVICGTNNTEGILNVQEQLMIIRGVETISDAASHSILLISFHIQVSACAECEHRPLKAS